MSAKTYIKQAAIRRKRLIDFVTKIGIVAVLIFHYRSTDSTEIAGNFQELKHSEFVTGERVSELCDVAFFTKEYMMTNPSVTLHAHQVIEVGTNLKRNACARVTVETSRVFFTKVDWIEYFVEEVLDHIQHDFVLVTHNSDLKSGTNYKILDHPRLRLWFGCNMVPHGRTQGIPLGLENPDMWKRTDTHHLANNMLRTKDKLVYVYFNTKTNEGVRRYARQVLERNGFKYSQPTSWPQYVRTLSRHKFCISPEGNGVDTHRMWECMYLGVIPIVVKTPALEQWFRDLPILWIDDFSQVTRNMLLEVNVDTLWNRCTSNCTIHTMTGLKHLIWKALNRTA